MAFWDNHNFPTPLSWWISIPRIFLETLRSFISNSLINKDFNWRIFFLLFVATNISPIYWTRMVQSYNYLNGVALSYSNTISCIATIVQLPELKCVSQLVKISHFNQYFIFVGNLQQLGVPCIFHIHFLTIFLAVTLLQPNNLLYLRQFHQSLGHVLP